MGLKGSVSADVLDLGGTMNKKFFTAWVVVFVAWFLGSYIVHGVLLAPDYMHLGSLFRVESDAQQYFPLMILAHVILSGAFVWIYARGVEPKPWMEQGVRFGVAIALLTSVPTYLIYFVVQPMPVILVIKQIVFDGILMLILGVIVAWLYRTRPFHGPHSSPFRETRAGGDRARDPLHGAGTTAYPRMPMLMVPQTGQSSDGRCLRNSHSAWATSSGQSSGVK